MPPPLATPLREALSVASGDSVSPAGSVGAERCPPGTCAPIGGAKLGLLFGRPYLKVATFEAESYKLWGVIKGGRQAPFGMKL